MHPAPIAWKGRLQVFDIDLDAFACTPVGSVSDVLDAEERQRASRMATPVLQQRFVAAHVATRRILGQALGVEPGSLRFSTGQFGKPHLATPGDAGLHFSLSHCQGRALLALAGDEVGVDLEGWIERDADMLAHEVLAPGELDRFRELPLDARPRQLARAWAAKEALFKACGLGLQLQPGSVTVEPHDGWHRLPEPADGSSWWLQHIGIDGPFCACVATRERVGVELVRAHFPST